MALLVRIEEAPLNKMESGNLDVVCADTVQDGRVMLRRANGLGGRKPFGHGMRSDVVHIVEDDSKVLQGEAGRNPTDLVVGLPLDGLLGFDNQVVYAHLFD